MNANSESLHLKLPPLSQLQVEVPSLDLILEPNLWLKKIADLQMNWARFQPSGEAVQWGNRVKMAIVGTVADVPIPGYCHRNLTVLVQEENPFGKTLMEGLIGVELGSLHTLSLSLPSDYQYAAWQNQTATYQVEIQQIDHVELPPLDDRFAKQVGKGATLAELGNILQKEMQTEISQHWQLQVRRLIVNSLLKKSHVVFPPALIQTSLKAIWEATELPLLKGCGFENLIFLKAFQVWLGHENIQHDYVQGIKEVQLFKAIVEQQKLTVTEAELQAMVEPMAQRFGLETDQALAEFQETGALVELKTHLLQNKVEQLLVSRVRLVHKGKFLLTQNLQQNKPER
jgi:trigger factor